SRRTRSVLIRFGLSGVWLSGSNRGGSTLLGGSEEERWMYRRLAKSWLSSKDKSMTSSVLCQTDSRSWRRSKMLIGRVGSSKSSLTKCVTARGHKPISYLYLFLMI
ncbi:hypothetical protein HID58_051929, partial [Brassica napus]